MSVSASREAFDLFNKSCRNNFRFKLKYNWNKLWWWKVVIADTWNRVCSARQPKEGEK